MSSKSGSAIASTWRWVFEHHRAVALLGAMVVLIDVVLVLVHAVVMAAFDAPNIWRVDMDGSYAEAYQYAKYAWIILLLAVASSAPGRRLLLCWIPLFAFFLLDDALMLHEIGGIWFSQQSWAFGIAVIGAQTVGELLVAGTVGVIVLAPLVVGFLRADRDLRRVFLVIAALLAVLLAFALIVDTIHSFFVDIRILDRGLGLLEDTGEMLALSAVAVVGFRLAVRADAPAPFATRSASRRHEQDADAAVPAPVLSGTAYRQADAGARHAAP